MQIVIKSDNEDLYYFISVYLKAFIKELFLENVNKNRLKHIDDKFKINSFSILNRAIDTMICTKIGKDYILRLDKVIKYKDNYLYKYVKIITYGNRECKGYNILVNILKYVSNNIGFIYKEWANGD